MLGKRCSRFQCVPKIILLLFVTMLLFGAGNNMASAAPLEEKSITPAEETKTGDEKGHDDLFDMELADLMEVRVTIASKRSETIYDAPGIVSVVSQEEIELFGDRNLQQILQRMPSVYVAGSYQLPNNTVSVRGDLPSILDNHSLPLINGRPVLWSQSGGVSFPLYQALPVEGLERIEMTRGPGSVLYGTNAFTGVLNLVPRTADGAPKFKISAHGGSYGHGDVSVSGGGRFRDVGVYVAARFMHEDGEKHRYFDEFGVKESVANRKKNTSILAHVDYKGFTLDLFAAQIETFHLGPFPSWAFTRHRWDAEKLFANLGYRLELGEKTHLEFNATYNYQDNLFTGTPPRTEKFDFYTSDILGEVTLYSRLTERIHFLAGYAGEHQANEDDNRAPTPAYSRTPQRAYAQLDYQLHDKVKLLAGFQWNRPDGGDSDFITRQGIIINFSEHWGMKLLRGEAFRAPWPNETDLDARPALVGNPDLDPEEVTTYDAQIFYHDQKNQCALTYFYSRMEDLIVRDLTVSPATFINGGSQQFWGLELEGKHYFSPELYLLGSVLYQDNQEASGVNSSVISGFMGKLGLGYTGKKWNGSLFYTHFSDPVTIRGAAEVNPDPDPQNLITANVRVDISSWTGISRAKTTLDLRVENLLDEDIDFPEYGRRQINSLPGGEGVAFYTGITMEF